MVQSDSICALKLLPYDEAMENSTILNINETQPAFWFQLPPNTHNLELSSISQINTSETETISMENVVRETGRIWIKVPSQYMDLGVGYHMYQFKFVQNDFLSTEYCLYACYRIQNNNTERSYIYMTHEEE